jgi:hypothetical protein
MGGLVAVEDAPRSTEAVRVLDLDGSASAEELFGQFCAWYRQQLLGDARVGERHPDYARLQRVVLLCHLERMCRTVEEALRELRSLALRPNRLGEAAGELAAVLEGLAAAGGPDPAT